MCGSLLEDYALSGRAFVEHRNGRRSLGKGAIVNVASLASYAAAPYKVQYVASKFAAMGITKTAGTSVLFLVYSKVATKIDLYGSGALYAGYSC